MRLGNTRTIASRLIACSQSSLTLLSLGFVIIEMVEMAHSPEEKKIVEEANSDDDVLAQLGYTQGKFKKS